LRRNDFDVEWAPQRPGGPPPTSPIRNDRASEKTAIRAAVIGPAAFQKIWRRLNLEMIVPNKQAETSPKNVCHFDN
jgi:hypothetical protein